MKLLSVANVASILGGTGRAALDCVRALPDWEHMILFLGRPSAKQKKGLVETFQAANTREVLLRFGRGRVRPLAAQWKPDVVLYHNTRKDQLPLTLPCPARRVYYQHSRHVVDASRYDARMMVSQGLIDACGFGGGQLVHQPVSPPALFEDTERRGRETPFTVGKLCTPTKSKWQGPQLNMYLELARRFPDVRFEFVGTPRAIQEGLLAEFGPERLAFHKAGLVAPSLLYRWHVMLHSGPWESYGRVICEAQQAGCLPITKSHGGTTEQIEHGKTGWLIHPRLGDESIEPWAESLGEASGLSFGMFTVNSSLAQIAARERGSLETWAEKFKSLAG